MKRTGIFKTCIAAAALVLSVAAQAGALTLTDQNSTVGIDTANSAGVHSWVVSGTNQLFQQWFWYRIGNDTGERAINTLSTATVNQLASNIAGIQYHGENGLKVNVVYLLTGAPSGTGESDLAETISLTNTGRESMSLHFFQYSDFDLNGTPGGQSISITGGNTATQTGAGVEMSETVVTPRPTHFQADYFANILNSLNDNAPTTLNDHASAGPGDMTWAFEWDLTILPGHTYIISKDKSLRAVPEPGTIVLLGAGLLGLGLFGRRRMKM